MTSHHPAKPLRTPRGDVADIDINLIPLILALWEAGYDTIGCCQDLGQNLERYDRKAAYWTGYAMIEMPYRDACRLLDTIRTVPPFDQRMHWAAPGAWEVSLPIVTVDGQAAQAMWAQIHFPASQISELLQVLTGGHLKGY